VEKKEGRKGKKKLIIILGFYVYILQKLKAKSQKPNK
jgi:hypothetical protein